MQDSLIIRPARAADKAAVVEFTATVWNGNDYLGSVWDEWLSASDGPLLVGELRGEAVAVAKLSELGEGEGWFQGLRVAPQARGQGFARRMLEHCAEFSRRRGDRSLRLMTDADNSAMQRVLAAAGFQLAVDGIWLYALLTGAESSLEVASTTRLPELLADLHTSGFRAPGAGLYSVGWRYLELNEARLLRHLEQGEVLALPRQDAWAIVVPDGHLWVGYAHGVPDQLHDLLKAIRTQPSTQVGQKARALMPRDSSLVAALIEAGYIDDDHGEQCYERVWQAVEIETNMKVVIPPGAP